MTVQIPHKTSFEKWQAGFSDVGVNSDWNLWDNEIQIATNEYNRHLWNTAGYIALDWRWIKAMVWVETGAHSASWRTKPIQIGKPGDAGLTSLLLGKEGGDLILPPSYRGSLSVSSVRSIPSHNIRAGIGYLLMRMARFDIREVQDVDTANYQVKVRAGESLEKIAKAQGTTVDVLRRMNKLPSNILNEGEQLIYRKAAMKKVIIGWRHMSAATIALVYNGGGDADYEKKLNYTMTLITA